ncbi:hypothetical protein Tco_0477176 [Tanacetum coccineum]
MEGGANTMVVGISGVSLKKQNSTGPNYIVGTDNYVWYFQLKTRNTTLKIHPNPLHQLHKPGEHIPPQALQLHSVCVKGQKEVAEQKAIFPKQAETGTLQTVREFSTCKQEEGQSVSSHFSKMKGYIDNLERLCQPVGQNLALACIIAAKERANPALHAIRAVSFQKNQRINRTKLVEEVKALRGEKVEAETSALICNVGDGHRVAVKAIGTYHMSSLVDIIVLNNCASTPAEKQRIQNIPYASAIGSIMYAVRCNSPDVAFAQNMTSRFQQNPGEEHWTAVKNILKYLRNTKDMFLNPKLYCDNTGAIAIAKDDGVTKGARHFRAKVHYLRETIKMGDVRIEKIDTDDNLADPFTKALAFPKHSELTRNIGLLPASRFPVTLCLISNWYNFGTGGLGAFDCGLIQGSSWRLITLVYLFQRRGNHLIRSRVLGFGKSVVLS